MSKMIQIQLSPDGTQLYGVDSDGLVWVTDVSMKTTAGPATNVTWHRVRNPKETFTPTIG